MTIDQGRQSAPPAPTFAEVLAKKLGRLRAFFEHVGAVTHLIGQTFRSLFTTRFEWRAFIYQTEQLGVKSIGIAFATAIFVGIVMALQFAYSLERFGARDSVGRIVGLTFTRELAASLTSLVVGCRIAAGMAAEIGSMAVTEQIDAIRALGADPVKKLVVPRMLAGVLIMPLLCAVALALGVLAAMVVCNLSFGIGMPFFLSSASDAVSIRGYASGLGETPFFGFLISVLGSYFGMQTRGGTEGVGRATTQAVVVVSISLLIANALLTQIFISF